MLSKRAVQSPTKSPSHQPIQPPTLALINVAKLRTTHIPGIDQSVNSIFLQVSQTNNTLRSIVT